MASTRTVLESHRVSRRHFLGAAAGGAVGLSGILAAGRAPAVAQTRELTFLTVASFVPETDKELKRQFEEWGAKNKVKVRLDIIAHLQLVTKKAAEVQARSGHDLTALGPGLGDADANVTLLSILWSYGGSYVAKDGRTITINSKETRQAMEFVKRLYTEAMDPEVLAWDDASNNRCLNAGKCIAIHNPISAYESAKKDKVIVPGTQREIADVIDHVNTPRGPVDRKATTGFWCVGVWNFSKNVDLAKDFLRYHFQPENLSRWVDAGHGFNMPFLSNLTRHAVYKSDKQYRFIPE